MKLLAIMGSYRKGKTIDTLIDRAIEGAKSVKPDLEAEKIVLIDHKIEYCRNCMACKKALPEKAYAHCVIDDDMRAVYPKIYEADCYLFGTPVNMGHETAIMKAFLERVCWIFARPGNRPIKGCPEPRSSRKKRTGLIVSSGLVPPLFSIFCDNATPLIGGFCSYALNAPIVDKFYAGAISKVGAEHYTGRAVQLGKKLVSG